MAKTAKKPTEGKQKKERKPRKQKPVITAEMAEQNDEGKFTGLPTMDEGQNILQFATLKKAAFADEATYLEYQAMVTEQRIENMTRRVSELREQAEISRKFGDSNLRRKAKSLAKKRAAIAALEEELAAAGIEL